MREERQSGTSDLIAALMALMTFLKPSYEMHGAMASYLLTYGYRGFIPNRKSGDKSKLSVSFADFVLRFLQAGGCSTERVGETKGRGERGEVEKKREEDETVFAAAWLSHYRDCSTMANDRPTMADTRTIFFVAV